jgi:hypothetical protein
VLKLFLELTETREKNLNSISLLHHPLACCLLLLHLLLLVMELQLNKPTFDLFPSANSVLIISLSLWKLEEDDTLLYLSHLMDQLPKQHQQQQQHDDDNLPSSNLPLTLILILLFDRRETFETTSH